MGKAGIELGSVAFEAKALPTRPRRRCALSLRYTELGQTAYDTHRAMTHTEPRR